MTNLAIYTVLTGDKELIGNPIARLESSQTDLDINFICFTDNPGLTSDIWECRVLETMALPSEKLSRRPKILPHKYLSEHSFSLYLDNICELKRLPSSADLRHDTGHDYCYKLFKHNTRSSIVEEALAIANIGYDRADILIKQLDCYKNAVGLDQICPLSTCTVILRQHNHPAVIRHAEAWWDHLLCFSKRDQMSFDFCRIVTGLLVEYFEGDKFLNDLIHPHSNTHSSRKLANFDEAKYIWLKNYYKLAGDNPKIVQEKASKEGINNPELLELLFYLFESSLGGFHMPRRNDSDRIQTVLKSTRSDSIVAIALFRENSKSTYWNINKQEGGKTLSALKAYLGVDSVPMIDYASTSDLGSLSQVIRDSKADLIFVFNATEADLKSIECHRLQLGRENLGSKFIVFPAENDRTVFYGC